MTESQVLPSETQAASQAATAAAPSAAAPAAATSSRMGARFRPMQAPSAPFWLLVIAGIVGLTILTLSWSVIFMFGIGLAVFAVLLPIVNRLDRRGLNRGIASLAAVAVTVLIVIGIAIAGIAVFFNQILPFLAAIPDTLAKIQAQAPPPIANAIQSILDAINAATADMDQGTVVLGFLKGALGIVGTALSLAVLPFFIFYMLVDQPSMASGFRSGIPGPWRPHVDASINIFRNDFVNYFRAEIVVGSIQGTIVMIGCFIIGLIVGPPFQGFAIFLGLLAGVMELLPQIGPIISLIPALLLALATSPLAVLLVSVFYVIDFIVEANVLVPKIEGQVINFKAALVLFIVLVGLAIGGIVGAILALPVAAIVRDMFGYLFRDAEERSLVEVVEPGSG